MGTYTKIEVEELLERLAHDIINGDDNNRSSI
jgi:hypothetical protein